MYVNLSLLQFMGKLISSLENELFVHYMFLDKAFTLPTCAGFPLKLSLSGVLAPGAKGGLIIDRMMVILLTSVNFGVSHLSSRLLIFSVIVHSNNSHSCHLWEWSLLPKWVFISQNLWQLGLKHTQTYTMKVR